MSALIDFWPAFVILAIMFVACIYLVLTEKETK